MVNDLIDGISIKLNQVFGDEKRIYSESVEQGLKEPCFFILLLNMEQSQIIGNRYFREQPFDIHYFPEKQGSNVEIQEVASELLTEMEFITLVNGDMIHGTKMNYETIDGVLHFFVNYNLIVKKVLEPIDKMEDLGIEQNTKRG